jgi:hypothetical protein
MGLDGCYSYELRWRFSSFERIWVSRSVRYVLHILHPDKVRWLVLAQGASLGSEHSVASLFSKYLGL